MAHKLNLGGSKLGLFGFGLVLMAGLSFRMADVLPGPWSANHLVVVFVIGTLMTLGLVIGLLSCLVCLFRDRGGLPAIVGLALAGVLFGRSIGLYVLMGAYGLIPVAPFLILGVAIFWIVRRNRKRRTLSSGGG